MPCDETKMKIMIVDDVPMNLKVLDTILRSLGHDVFAFPRGDMFLSAVRAAPPDLVLLDINLPDMDSYGICALLKEDQTLRDIPVIFVSALTEPLDKLKAFGAGGADYIAKPFDISEVRARVATHLEIRRLRRELDRTIRTHEERMDALVRETAEAGRAIIRALAGLAEFRNDDSSVNPDRVRGFRRILSEGISDLLSLEPRPRPDELK